MQKKKYGDTKSCGANLSKDQISRKCLTKWPEYQELISGNFSSIGVESVDGKFGGLTSNGTFNGMIGMLQRQEVDFAAMAISVMNTRAQVADPGLPMGYLKQVSMFDF